MVEVVSNFLRKALLDETWLKDIYKPTTSMPAGVKWSHEDWLSDKIISGQLAETIINGEKRYILGDTVRVFEKVYGPATTAGGIGTEGWIDYCIWISPETTFGAQC